MSAGAHRDELSYEDLVKLRVVRDPDHMMWFIT